MANPELHLFIIWDKARPKEQAILRDIRKNFKVLKTYEMHWSRRNFAKNLTRFYGTNLPTGSGKEEHVGTGPFLLVVVEDKTPYYKVHDTSKGQLRVNSNTFLAKNLHREWTGGGHRIHATNTPQETEHDLTLLLGLNTQDFLKTVGKHSKAWLETVEIYRSDLVGTAGWESLRQLFYTLNSTIDYIVMRNFEPLPDKFYSKEHGDIDLLTSDYEQISYITNAIPLFPEPYRVHNRVLIGDEWVLFDFRHIGDGYYDTVWQQTLIAGRRLNKAGIYVPDKNEYFYSLLYHALIHKPQVSPDYVDRLRSLRPKASWDVGTDFFIAGRAHKVLGRYLAEQGYGVSFPRDLSVYMNKPNLSRTKRAIWAARPVKYGLKKLSKYIH